MPLKTFEGPNVGSLLTQIRIELGPDAVILDVAQRAGGVALTAADPEAARTLARPRARPQPVTVPRRPIPPAPVAPPAARSAPALAPQPSAETPSRRFDRRSGRPLDPRPLILAFVGPTGAGKTTTIAKLAAHPHLFSGAPAGILNLDTYRVGATEQISQYGALSGVPVVSAHSAADLPAARRALRGCRVILVDCPGRGPQLHRDTTTVGEMLDLLRPAERHLVMPVGTQPALVRRTVEHFRALKITHLLATKVDEMPDDWILFDVAVDLQLPMRWLADGQAVPQDLRSASARLDAATTNRRLRRRAVVEDVA